MSAEQLEAFEASVRAAKEAWEVLDGPQGLFRSLHRSVRAAVITLCVEDKPIGPVALADVRGVIDHLALRWPDKPGKSKPIRLGPVPEITTEMPAPKRNRDTILQAFEVVTRKLAPKLDEEGMDLAKQTFLALIDRDRFRAKKNRTI